MRRDSEAVGMRGCARAKRMGGAVLLLAVAVSAQSTGKPGPSTGSEKASAARARPSVEARAALRAAAGLRKTATGKKGKVRHEILSRVAQAYVKVSQDFAAEPVVVAQACFAAAENWRAAGNSDVAKPLYRRAIELDGSRFGARAHLQLGHLARRGKDLGAAITAYRKAESLEARSSRGHQARLWVGRCQLLQPGQVEAALSTFRSAIDRAPSPRNALDACNRLANALVKLGRLEQAQKVIARAETESKKAAGGSGKNAETRQRGLAKAFASMSARRALQRALDKKNKAHQDAVEVEKSGRR